MFEREESVIVKCACCGKTVIIKHRSKRRCCSHACFMRLYRLDKKAAEQLSSAQAA